MFSKSRRETDSFTVSFLDVASCGFGAMIILLMITKSSAPDPTEFFDFIPDASVADLQRQLFAIRGESRILNRELNAKQEQLSALTERIARLRRDLNNVQGRFNASNQRSQEMTEEVGRLSLARQTLTEEMQRLLANSPSEDNAIGGVPVDSEYIIFVIDTSGSMHYTPGNWDKLLEVVDNTLDVYPEVKGIQVMNDMGEYMFNSYRNQWIPDTPGRRRQIISTLQYWQPYSNSSPVEGVTEAIRTFYSEDRKISIYVLGDDFPPDGSIQNVLRIIDRINRKDASGDRLVRIHGIGFPTIFTESERFQRGVFRFGHLMREMTQRNGGTFVALSSFQ